MKSKFLFISILSFFFNFLVAQEFEKFKSISIYAGVQNPNEIALLDFAGNGPIQVFSPSVIIGLAYNIDWKKTALSFHTDYQHSPIEFFSGITDDPNIHSLLLSSKFWYNFLKPESKMRLKAGIGIVIDVFRYPETTYMWDAGTGFPSEVLHENAFVSATGGIASGINFTYKTNKRLYFNMLLGNDFILNYGDTESVIVSSLAVGLNYRISK